MMVILFILGMFLDWVGILLLTVPIFLPILTALTFGGLFGISGVSSDDLSLWSASSSWSTCRWRF